MVNQILLFKLLLGKYKPYEYSQALQQVAYESGEGTNLWRAYKYFEYRVGSNTLQKSKDEWSLHDFRRVEGSILHYRVWHKEIFWEWLNFRYRILYFIYS